MLDDSIAIYRVNPVTRALENVAARTIQLDLPLYGLCMYRSPVTGKHYVFATSGSGKIEQWELFDNGSGRVDATRQRTFDVGSKSEGCVADDSYGHLYISEEQLGILKYGAEPNADDGRTLVDTTGANGHLTADVEGLAIYYGPNGTGYLLASSQGDDTFAVYQREGTNPYIMSFTIGTGNGIDGVSHTDGIHVASASLGSAFPQGMFVAQDDDNDQGNQNFKLVSWQAIAEMLP
jgi:3-phytase